MANMKAPEFPRGGHGDHVAVKMISESLASSQYTVPTGTAQVHSLNAKTGIVTITVADYPVKMRASDSVTSSVFDHYLITGQYEFMLGEGVDTLSFLGDGGDSLVTLVERDEV